MNALRLALRWALAVFFMVAGANHFRSPQVYLGMMPPWMPWPDALNVITGAAEVLGGVGLIAPWVGARRLAGWGLFALLLAIFPANLHVATQGKMLSLNFSSTVLWWRLPFQAVFMACVWWVAVAKPR